jgi:lysophospholipid acyltransferase (LPLAT)-like uncharacterized protein
MGRMKVKERLRGILVSTIGKPVYRLWMRSLRIVVRGEEYYRPLREKNKPVILAIWHGRIFVAPFFFRHRNIMPMVSPSGDGEIVVRLASGWGYRFLRGSGSHSLHKAWTTLLRTLEEGGEVIIVPDGPKGPDRVMKQGALKLSQASGAAVVPVSFSCPRRKFLRSWDRFLMPRPFQRVVAVYGEPLTVSPDLDEAENERERVRLEERLTALDEQADSYFDK